jgi:transposase-like protein
LSGVESALTGAPNADPPCDGRSHRRHFTSEEKLAIVLECERPGASVSAVARAHQLATSALFRWRAEFGYGRKEKIKLSAWELPQPGATISNLEKLLAFAGSEARRKSKREIPYVAGPALCAIARRSET